MSTSFTKKYYPIQTIWIFKPFVSLILYVVVMPLLARTFYEVIFYMIFFVIAAGISTAITYLKVNAFSFDFKDTLVTLNQGIISKQQRDLQYSVIQNIIVKRDIFSRIFGLASFTFENAAGGGGFSNMMKASKNSKYSVYQNDFLGFSGNLVCIPGLKNTDAEKLKTFLMERLTATQRSGDVSGL